MTGPASSDLDLAGLSVRWLGSVPYREALDLQRAIFGGRSDHLLLLTHPHTYTLGVRADAANILVPPESVGAELVDVDRGGDVTYHGPGQLVGYPIVSLPEAADGRLPSTRAYVRALEDTLIRVLARVGMTGAGVVDDQPGVWIDPEGPRPRKIAAVGVRIVRGRTMHGFALNVDCDLDMFGHIVPCGIADRGVTSIRAEGVDATMADVVDALVGEVAATWTSGPVDRSDVVWRRAPDDTDLSRFSRGEGPGSPVRYRTEVDSTNVRLTGRLAEAGVSGGVSPIDPKPDWMRARLNHGDEVRSLRRTLRSLDLVTVCEEAGCPNLSECWTDGTATFMVCGERCTRACGFCLVDTRRPEPLDADEPRRVAEAVDALELDHVVLTMVARDDLADGGAAHVAETIRAVHDRRPGSRVEALISDLRGDPEALETVLAADPAVLNHNVETVPRLQRAVRPSASYARSLTLLGRAGASAVTKSGLVVGMGETDGEVRSTLIDLAAVGVDIVTIGQYLRPTTHHLPVERWWEPGQFEEWKRFGEDELGLGHVESSPLTRSSYHARSAAAGVAVAAPRPGEELVGH